MDIEQLLKDVGELDAAIATICDGLDVQPGMGWPSGGVA
jgi:hypothetical protein